MAAFCARVCPRRRAAAVEPVPVCRRTISGNGAGLSALPARNFVSCVATADGLRLVPAVAFCTGGCARVCTCAWAGSGLHQRAAGWRRVSRRAAAHGQRRLPDDRKWRSVAAVAAAGSFARWHAGRCTGALVVCGCTGNWYATTGRTSGGGCVFADCGGLAGRVAAAGGCSAAFRGYARAAFACCNAFCNGCAWFWNWRGAVFAAAGGRA